MPQSATASDFLARCQEWLCDGYSVDTRYIATAGDSGQTLFDAVILFNPLPHTADNRLSLSLPSLLVGQEQLAGIDKEHLLAIVRKALDGTISANGRELSLPTAEPHRFQSAGADQNTWYRPLAVQIHGAAPSAPLDYSSIDSALRAAATPFDGLEDLRVWLGLRPPDSQSLSTISVVVHPPVDLLVDRSSLSESNLHLVLHAHPKANRSQLRVAIRTFPGEGLLGRVQVADRIVWGEVTDGLVEGRAHISLVNATAALAMLLIGADTARRNWFFDPAKAPNQRYAAVQQFDSELRMLKRGLNDDTDSRRFETAIATLLFLLGFSPAAQLETNAPDLIVATPAGRLVLVECTTRIADVQAKIGKLVDRREALLRALREGNQGTEVVAALVCRQPRDQIAAHADTLRTMRIILAASEDITNALIRARLPSDPENTLTQALRSFET